MKKKTWYSLGAGALLLIGIALFLLLQPSSGSGTYENLIENGDFEALNDQGMPLSWYQDAYVYQGYTLFSATEGMEGKGVEIQNKQPNDARFAQTVAVSPNTLYHLHGYVKTDAQGGRGANLSIEGITVFSESYYDTQDGWQEVSLYGRTGKNQRSVTVFARLGGYSGEATGVASFDNISLCRVDSVPAGFVENQWYSEPVQVQPAEEKAANNAWILILGSVMYIALFLLLIRIPHAQDSLRISEKKSLSTLITMLLCAFFLRIAAALLIPGYDVDIGCFTAWAKQMASLGPARFYQGVGFCDYPPGYMWILWLLGLIGQITGDVTEFMVKTPPILSDLLLCILLYTEGKKHLSDRNALALSCLYAFSPLALATGAAWGQTDSIMTLLLMLTVIMAIREKWIIALPVYVAAVLVKPQSLMFGPLGAAALILHILQSWKDQESRKQMLRDVGLGLLLAAAAGALIVVPFSVNQASASWLIELYTHTMGQYSYATVNACNIYFLMGKNWVNGLTDISGDWLIAAITWLLCALPLFIDRFTLEKSLKEQMKDKKEKRRFLYHMLFAGALLVAILSLALLGQLTYSSLGTLVILYSVLLMSYCYFSGKDAKNLPFLGAVLLIMLYSGGSMMHERYIFPAAALLLLAYALKKDKRILYLAVAVCVTGFLNVGAGLERNIRIGGSAGHLNAPAFGIKSDLAFLEYFAAIMNCLLCSLSILLSLQLCRDNAPILAFDPAKKLAKENAPALPKRQAPLPERGRIRKMTARDYLIMGVVTLLYAALAFTNLGSMKAPQNGWVSSDANEQIVIDLGEEKSFQMLYFGGIHWYDSDFTVETSHDGLRWDRSYNAAMKVGDCFKWKYVAEYNGGYGANLSGRYIRINAGHYGLTLFETLLLDPVTKEPILPVSVESNMEGADASALFDEPDTLEGEPGWYNSTYFDEIYHARTAYEHLHGLRTYETTHPPLGKVFMSWCISLFGMTPFGWRFAGALAGVLMLPGMYLLGQLLIRKKWGGFGAMMLMALDLMHFTQTRIATIDSFVVLFIIWSVYFMLRWFFLDYFSTKFWKTLIPLGLSGLFMGLSIASKWTGCYSAVGLALIFFFGLWRRYREVCAAKKHMEEQKQAHEKHAADIQRKIKRGKLDQSAAENIPVFAPDLYEEKATKGIKPLLITVGSCFIFFIAVPLLIYYLSYIPYFAYSGGVSVQKVIQAAEGMLSYHATPGLGMDHHFYSPWYQWPVIAKPIWYFSTGFEPAGLQSTIMAMGNPAVWWTGLVGLIFIILLWAKRHFRSDHTLSLHAEEDEPRYAILLLCFAAQYLPWVLVPRGTYIYHYFPSVPFIILCTLLSLEWLSGKREKAAKIALFALLLIAALLFIAFFPYASGVAVSQKWMDAMKWFPRWLWY